MLAGFHDRKPGYPLELTDIFGEHAEVIRQRGGSNDCIGSSDLLTSVEERES